MKALAKFIARNKGSIGKLLSESAEKAESVKDAGKMGLGALSLAGKKLAKTSSENPKSVAALLGAGAGYGAAKASEDDGDEDDKKKKKKKKREYMDDED